MNDQLANPAFRSRLVRKLSRDGKFTVRFVVCPNRSEVFEFIGLPNARGIRVRYVNLTAREDANVSVLLQR